jgi:pyruvate,water dikinase
MTRYWVETHPAAFERGFGDMTRFYGLLIDTTVTRYVNGYAYTKRRPVAQEEVPERFKRAEEVFEGKLWREQLRDWDETAKPSSIATHRSLQSMDPDAMDDAELAAYLERCRDHHAAMISQHMRYTGAAMVPVGDLLAHAGEWTGLPPAQLLDMMRGAAPVSAGASAEQEALIGALTEDQTARGVLESDGDPAEVLQRLREHDGDAGRAVSAYLDLVGYRLLDGFDISGRYALELPDALLRSIRASLERSSDATDVDDQIAAVRDRVPAEHADAFDELLAEARLTYRIRDERGVFSDIWACGIMRRAVLAGGSRLAARGAAPRPRAPRRRGGRRDAVPAGRREDAVRGRAGGPVPRPDLAGRQGRARRPRGPTVAAAGPVRAPAGHGTRHAGQRHLHHGPVRQLRSAARGGPPAGVRRERRRLRGPRTASRRPRRVRPDPAGRRPGDRVHDRGVQHPPAAARRDRDRQRRTALPTRRSLRASTASRGVVGTRDGTDRIADGARVRVDGDAGEVAVLG